MWVRRRFAQIGRKFIAVDMPAANKVMLQMHAVFADLSGIKSVRAPGRAWQLPNPVA